MWGLCSTAKGNVTVWIILGNDNQCERSGMLSGKSCSVCQCRLPSAGCSSILSGLLFPILRPSIITTFTEETHTSLSRAPCRSCNLLDISCASTPASIHRCRRDRHLPRTQPRAAHLVLTPACQQPKYNSLPLSSLSPEIRVTHGAVG